MALAPQELPQLHYFCDESSQVKDDWLAVGGLAVMESAIPRIVADLEAIKGGVGKSGEVKWDNAKSFGGRAHRAYIDYLFLLIQNRKAHFHIRFSRMGEYDHGLSGPRKKIDTVSKSYYQLLLHRTLRYYSGKANVFVFPDDGECTCQLPGQMTPLGIDGRTEYGNGAADCIKAIECRASVNEPLLQLLDVTLGALTAMRNNRHTRDDYHQIRKDLIAHAFTKTGWATIEGSTDIMKRDCNRWTRRPTRRG